LRNLVLDPLDYPLVVFNPVSFLESQPLVANPEKEVAPKGTGLVPSFEEIGDLVVGEA